jgi:hypothetical protein
MRTALIVTLGTRDLTVDKTGFLEKFTLDQWEGIFNEKRNALKPKSGAEFLLKNYTALSKYIEFPILLPALEYCIKEQEVIHKLIFVATDQRGNAEQRFLENDTIFIAQVLQKLITQKYSKNLGDDNPIRIITVKKNVSYLDLMVDFFNDRKNGKYLFEALDFDDVYLLPQAGIPPVNTALMLKSIQLYKQSLTILRVNEENSVCYRLDFTMQFLESERRQRIVTAINQFNYATVAEETDDSDLSCLAHYALHRLYFDFDTAESYLKKLSRKNRGLSTLFLNELTEIRSSQLNLLREIYANAKIKFTQKAYVDFLLRTFRIVEEFAKINVIKRLDFTYNHYAFEKDFTAFLTKPENEKLKYFLEKETFRGKKLDYFHPNITVLSAIFRFYEPDKAAQLEKIKILSEVRNKSIGAHDFKPVSLKIINDALSQKGIQITEVFAMLDELLGYDKNPFLKINEEMLKNS